MNTLQTFREYKTKITEQWIEAVYSTYPLDTKGFLRTQKDPFCSPVGEITTTLAGYLYDAVVGEHIIEDKFQNALERFVKLRSVQEYSPSQGLGVLYVFKHLLRTDVLPVFAQAGKIQEYLEAESRLDTLALMALDIYVASRETLAEQRIKEIRDQHSQVVRWAQKHNMPKDSSAV